MTKKLLTLGAVALLSSTSLFAAGDSLQEHFQMEQKLQKQYQKRLKDGSGSTHMNQYNYQNQHEYMYNGTNPNRSNAGSSFGQRSGGGRR